MLQTFTDLLKSLVCVGAFGPFLLAPGYLLTSLDAMQRTRRTWVTRGLWSIVLSLPMSLLLAVALGSVLPPWAVLCCFAALTVAAVLHLRQALRMSTPPVALRWDRETKLVLAFVALLTTYCLVGPLSVQIGHHVYESAMWQDWAVRIQLVDAALRGGVPPGNPFFAPGGQPPPLRYYYYFYVLCAQVCRITGLDAKSALVASCVWSGFALVACLLLSLRTMGAGRKNMRVQGAVALLLLCVTGLDVIPAVIGLFLRRPRLYPDIEFWHDDRSPSWLGSLLWAPHHVAGFVCCMTAVLLLFLVRREDSWPRRGLFALLVGACMSAALGTSTYITVFFAIAMSLLVVERALYRDLRFGGTVLFAGVFSLAMSFSYVNALVFSHSAAAVGSQAAHTLARFVLRNDIQANRIYLYFFYTVRHRPWPAHASALQRGIRALIVLGFFVVESGFFLFVLLDRIRKDARGGLRHKQIRWWWILFASFTVPGLALSSSALQGNNDLGRHAGMCARFVLICWATPLVTRFVVSKEHYRVPVLRTRILRMVVTACLVLGLLTQTWEIVINRIYNPLVEAKNSGTTLIAMRYPHMSTRFYDIRRAMQAAAAHTARNEVVQTDPQGRLQPIFELYTSRQMAAGDLGCASPFGGDPALCPGLVKPLVGLFGGSGPRHQGDYWEPKSALDPIQTTPANFAAVCAAEKLSVLAVSYADPVWREPESWVWQLQPMFANSSARVFLCPKA